MGQSDSRVLAERWNGTKWRLQHIPTPAGAHGAGLGGISCTSPSFCIAAGAYFTTSNQSGPAKPFAERWNGRRWRILAIPEPARAVQTFFGGISCTSPSACTAAGEQHFKTGIVHTVAARWNGKTWRVQPTPNPPGVQFASLGGVACTGPSACIAAGGSDQGTIAERWNGTSWVIQSTPTPAGGGQLFGVACPAPAACTAVGLAPTNLGGMVLAERWNGNKWHIQPTPFIPALSIQTSSPPAVACPARIACTAVGGYEAPGPTSVTLAEQWNGSGATTQPAARPSGGASRSLVCADTLERAPFVRRELRLSATSAESCALGLLVKLPCVGGCREERRPGLPVQRAAFRPAPSRRSVEVPSERHQEVAPIERHQ